MTFILILLGFFCFGAFLAVIIKGVPAIAKLAFQFLQLFYGIFILLPLQIIRKIQGKPPVSPTKNE